MKVFVVLCCEDNSLQKERRVMPEQTRVFVVLSPGDCDDEPSVGGVFSSREAAERYIEKARSLWSRGRWLIEEASVDFWANAEPRLYYRVTVDIDSGKKVRTDVNRAMANPDQETFGYPDGFCNNFLHRCITQVYAFSFVSEQHALEQALAFRDEILRLRKEHNVSS